MDDLISRTALIAEYDRVHVGAPGGARKLMEDAPAVDAVPVVRCENCKYWNPRYETMGMCMKHNSIVTFTKPNFFCAWGEGKQK